MDRIKFISSDRYYFSKVNRKIMKSSNLNEIILYKKYSRIVFSKSKKAQVVLQFSMYNSIRKLLDMARRIFQNYKLQIQRQFDRDLQKLHG